MYRSAVFVVVNAWKRLIRVTINVWVWTTNVPITCPANITLRDTKWREGSAIWTILDFLVERTFNYKWRFWIQDSHQAGNATIAAHHTVCIYITGAIAQSFTRPPCKTACSLITRKSCFTLATLERSLWKESSQFGSSTFVFHHLWLLCLTCQFWW